MKIGVISDTHLRGPDERLLDIIRKHLHDAVLILHAGDLPANHIREGILFFNPGTACERRHAGSNTVGILEVGEDKIAGRIIALDED